jgi:hypothetical protein
MLTYNDLAILLDAQHRNDTAQTKLARRQKTIIGRLPIVRAELHSRQTKLQAQGIQIKAAREYTESYLSVVELMEEEAS